MESHGDVVVRVVVRGWVARVSVRNIFLLQYFFYFFFSETRRIIYIIIYNQHTYEPYIRYDTYIHKTSTVVNGRNTQPNQ